VQINALEVDKLQKVIAGLIATSPVGVNLLLIGGFRYRLLNNSQRVSVDIDYHWAGDFETKQKELLRLCQRSILREIYREFGYEGKASLGSGPEVDSPNVKTVELRFWTKATQLEIPLEVTQIPALDPPIIRTAHGIVHPTLSDADIIEGKVIAVLNRLFLQHRDLVDIFLYGDTVREDSAARVQQKLSMLSVSTEAILRRLADLRQNREYHAKAVQKVIDEQLEAVAAQQITLGGGGEVVLDSALRVLFRLCEP
jgi:hypothetical protein